MKKVHNSSMKIFLTLLNLSLMIFTNAQGANVNCSSGKYVLNFRCSQMKF